jgi:hypothetical protein
MGRRLAAAGILAVILSPIETDRGLVGLLIFGTRSPENVSHLIEQLPAAVEFTATAKALLGPALEERMDTVAAQDCIRAIVADRAFSPVFQPIVKLGSRRIVGYEALTRFASGRRPDSVFADAARVGQGSLLEQATLESALRASARRRGRCHPSGCRRGRRMSTRRPGESSTAGATLGTSWLLYWFVDDLFGTGEEVPNKRTTRSSSGQI